MLAIRRLRVAARPAPTPRRVPAPAARCPRRRHRSPCRPRTDPTASPIDQPPIARPPVPRRCRTAPQMGWRPSSTRRLSPRPHPPSSPLRTLHHTHRSGPIRRNFANRAPRRCGRVRFARLRSRPRLSERRSQRKKRSQRKRRSRRGPPAAQAGRTWRPAADRTTPSGTSTLRRRQIVGTSRPNAVPAEPRIARFRSAAARAASESAARSGPGAESANAADRQSAALRAASHPDRTRRPAAGQAHRAGCRSDRSRAPRPRRRLRPARLPTDPHHPVTAAAAARRDRLRRRTDSGRRPVRRRRRHRRSRPSPRPRRTDPARRHPARSASRPCRGTAAAGSARTTCRSRPACSGPAGSQTGPASGSGHEDRSTRRRPACSAGPGRWPPARRHRAAARRCGPAAWPSPGSAAGLRAAARRGGPAASPSPRTRCSRGGPAGTRSGRGGSRSARPACPAACRTGRRCGSSTGRG